MGSLLYALLLAGLFYYGILYENDMMLVLGFTLGLLLLLSVIEVVYRLFTIKCRLDIPVSMAEQNLPVDVAFRLDNQSRFPTGRIEIRMRIRNFLAKKGKTGWLSIPGLRAGQSKHSFPVVLHGAGSHEVELIKLRIHSLLGLFSLTRKCSDFGSILVLPEVHSTLIQVSEATHNFMGEADVYDEFRPGHDPAETFEIRAYRPKDKLQSIHWKLSAKMDDLMVREQGDPKACGIIVLLDLKPKPEAKMETSVADFLELAVTVSFALLEQKTPHFVAWLSKETGDVRRIRVDDEESFYLFIIHYLRDGIAQESKQLRGEYREKFKNEYYLHDILLTNDLEVFRDDKLITKLDEKKLKDECEKLELIL